ncbi:MULTISPECIES: glycosyltransferase [unclassified Nocardioides]|uniref:glycosyltransferase n=1 Tax=unclassified Nocardioides TaxID=2615069 RepID=UPI00301472E8
MRVLVASTAGSGHFGPLVPVARACAEAGHDVAVAAPASFADEVAGAGFGHLPFADVRPEVLGEVMGRLPSLSTEDANRVVVAEVFGRLDAQAALPGVAATIEEWRPDVVLREPTELGSLAAALAAGVPQVVVAVGVSSLLARVTDLLAEPLVELDELAGLRPGACSAAIRAGTTLTSVPAVLDEAITSVVPYDGPVIRYRVPPATGPGRLPGEWGDPEEPLVYVSFGSVAAALPPFARVYPAVLEALADQPVRVLLTTGRGVALDTLVVPPNTRLEQWWPQDAVLPLASVVVGHGGFGTTMAALGVGIPQVVLPLFAMDQFVNADHVAAVGAGIGLLGGVDAVGDLPAALSTVLADPRHRQAAGAVADAMAALRPVGDAVRILERI